MADGPRVPDAKSIAIINSQYHSLLLGATSPPAQLYHYTSISALLNILSTFPLPEFWATEALSMADAEECLFAAPRVADKLQGAGAAPAIVANFQVDTATQILSSQIFVASFCAQPDSRRHWQDYGDKCRGCAIQFDRATLATASGVFSEIAPVRYGDQALNTFFDPFVALLAASAPKSADPQYFWHWATNKLLQSLAFFKADGYRHETEFRMAILPQTERAIDLRFDDQRAIQYLALRIPPSAIRSVILGRDCHPRNQRVLQQAFTRNQRWTGHLVTVTAAGS